MSHIDGSIGTIDLVDPQPSDYFKIGVTHGENGFALEPTYLIQPSYLEGYAFGAAMRPFLEPRYASTARTLTYELMTDRFSSYQDGSNLTYDQLTNYAI